MNKIDLTEKLTNYLAATLRKKSAEKELEEAKPSLMDEFAAYVRGGGTKVTIKTPWWVGHATYVAPRVNTEIDVDKLKEALSPEQWAEISAETVDPTKLTAAVDLGRIPKATVNACTIEKPVAGFPRFTGHPVEAEPVAVDQAPETAPVRIVGRRKVVAPR